MARPAFKSSYRISGVSVSSPSITGSTLSRVGSSVGRIFLNWIGWLTVSFLFIVESIYFNSLIMTLLFRFQACFRKSCKLFLLDFPVLLRNRNEQDRLLHHCYRFHLRLRYFLCRFFHYYPYFLLFHVLIRSYHEKTSNL